MPTAESSYSVPYLLVCFTADPQHFFTLMLQLSGQSVDGLIQRVDLVIQVRDAVVAGTHLRLQIRDPCQQFLFLHTRKARRFWWSTSKKLLLEAENTQFRFVTCLWLCSMALSSSRLAAEFSLRWICLRCSIDEAWRWLSSARSDAVIESQAVAQHDDIRLCFLRFITSYIIQWILTYIYLWENSWLFKWLENAPWC